MERQSIELYTVQMGKWRIPKKMGIPLIDATVKSGHKELAPTWDMIRDIKEGHRDCDFFNPAETYTLKYLAMLMDSYRENQVFWASLLTNKAMAIACYCPDGKFCHRFPLKDFITTMAFAKGITVIYKGELK